MRAILAPSVHNTQPWRFVLRPSGLEVLADPERRLAVLDPTGRQLHLSVGCALFNARVSLAASGYATTILRSPEPTRPDLLATVMIVDQDQPDPELAVLDAAIDLRQTNRRRFNGVEVPEDLVALLVAAAAAESSLMVAVRTADDRAALSQIWLRADGMLTVDPAYRAELRAWTSNAPGRRDGVPARTVPHVDAGSGDDVPIRDFDSAGMGWLPTETHSSLDQCLLLLGNAEENSAAWLKSGEALERVWLEITRAGYVASLFTQAIEVAPLRAQLREDLRLVMHPSVLLRVGQAPVTPSTSRRAISDVFTDLTE